MENKIIKVFDTDEYKFLSNFYPYRQNLLKETCSFVVEYDGIEFDCVEKAYQAAKCSKRADRFQFQNIPAENAASLAHSGQIEMRQDWPEIEFRTLYQLVWQKFSFCEELRQKLLATGDAVITDVDDCRYLGEILMRVRNAVK